MSLEACVLPGRRHRRMIPSCDQSFRPGPSPSYSPTSRGRRGCCTHSAPRLCRGPCRAPAGDPRGLRARGRGRGRHAGRRVFLRLRKRARCDLRCRGLHGGACVGPGPGSRRPAYGHAPRYSGGLRRQRRPPCRPGRSELAWRPGRALARDRSNHRARARSISASTDSRTSRRRCRSSSSARAPSRR